MKCERILFLSYSPHRRYPSIAHRIREAERIPVDPHGFFQTSKDEPDTASPHGRNRQACVRKLRTKSLFSDIDWGPSQKRL